jgi:hypothetical protein
MAIDYEYDWAIIVCFAPELIVRWDKLSLSRLDKQDFRDDGFLRISDHGIMSVIESPICQ